MGLLGGYVNPQGGGGGGTANAPSTSGGVTSGQVVAEVLLDGTFTAGETISGVKAVCFSQSGTLLVARAGTSGRMPAVGVTTSNFISGNVVTAWRGGRFFDTPLNFSGWPNRPVFVGWSGDLVASGAPTNSGDILQVVGVTINASGFMVSLGDAFQATVAKSGDIGSGAVTGQGGGGYLVIASGSIATSDMGSGAVQSGQLSSGVIGRFHLSSGAVGSGVLGSGSVAGQAGGGAFCVASGSLGTYDHASGVTVTRGQFVAPIYSGTPWSGQTSETISGIRAVSVSQSGWIQIAMAAVSGRGPAIGAVIDNVLSGIQCNVYTQGVIVPASGLFTAIGFFGQPVWLGRSGHIVPLSGSFGSGGFASGDEGQKMGVALAIGSGAILLNLNTTVWSGGPLGEATGGGIL